MGWNWNVPFYETGMLKLLRLDKSYHIMIFTPMNPNILMTRVSSLKSLQKSDLRIQNP